LAAWPERSRWDVAAFRVTVATPLHQQFTAVRAPALRPAGCRQSRPDAGSPALATFGDLCGGWLTDTPRAPRLFSRTNTAPPVYHAGLPTASPAPKSPVTTSSFENGAAGAPTATAPARYPAVSRPTIATRAPCADRPESRRRRASLPTTAPHRKATPGALRFAGAAAGGPAHRPPTGPGPPGTARLPFVR
jgi:hypothetical protein